VCMERRCDAVLVCAHAFCAPCMEEVRAQLCVAAVRGAPG
jgi:hypothetical protein